MDQESKKRPIENLQIIGTDIDTAMIDKAKLLTNAYAPQIDILHRSYADIAGISSQFGLFDCELLDLGVNLEHFKD